MEWLNYHHLHYFWTVAREGSVAAAGRKLRLSHSTLVIQIHQLEERLREKLFVRVGRKLELTEMGRIVLRYADEIFSLGNEMLDVVRGRPTEGPVRTVVGVARAMPKMLVRQLLRPLEALQRPMLLTCRESSTDQLVADLLSHKIDVALAETPLTGEGNRRVFSHLLGECGVSFFGTRELVSRHKRGFPASLDGAPLLVPTPGTSLRVALDQWFLAENIHPRLVAEFDDSALMKVFGQDGLGIFAAPTAAEEFVRRQYEVAVLGRTRAISERFFAVSVERRITHPGVVAICSAARSDLFARSLRLR